MVVKTRTGRDLPPNVYAGPRYWMMIAKRRKWNSFLMIYSTLHEISDRSQYGCFARQRAPQSITNRHSEYYEESTCAGPPLLDLFDGVVKHGRLRFASERIYMRDLDMWIGDSKRSEMEQFWM
ncbi:hypothetical protein CDAR_619931, partial [Caerostris darwini]